MFIYLSQENTAVVPKQQVNLQDGRLTAVATEGDMKVTVERELVSQAEEEDMEALLGTYVLQFIQANSCLLYLVLHWSHCLKCSIICM